VRGLQVQARALGARLCELHLDVQRALAGPHDAAGNGHVVVHAERVPQVDGVHRGRHQQRRARVGEPVIAARPGRSLVGLHATLKQGQKHFLCPPRPSPAAAAARAGILVLLRAWTLPG